MASVPHVYDVSRAFCVERVHLTDVEPAVLCVDSIVNALLKERRSQAKEKGDRCQPVGALSVPGLRHFAFTPHTTLFTKGNS